MYDLKDLDIWFSTNQTIDPSWHKGKKHEKNGIN
jgi:hypothetical protein